MRARGAKVTDIVVLVIAADDGVMPQSVESINHAKAAGVPIVVALNKIDKPEATEKNIQRINGQLAEHGLNPVEWGGSTEVIKTSAAKNTGIQELLDVLDYQAELLGLKADYKGLAQGTVLEAQLEEGRGAVARLIVQEGTLNRSDFVVIGRAFGRVRDLVNDKGQRVDSAGPSTPVAISGIDMMPDAGDKFFCVKSLPDAEDAAHERRRIERDRDAGSIARGGTSYAVVKHRRRRNRRYRTRATSGLFRVAFVRAPMGLSRRGSCRLRASPSRAHRALRSR
jgi:translation initiation factor IF-2